MQRAGNSDHFALFDADDGGALLLTGYRDTLALDASDDLPGLFAKLENAASQGIWVALAADYELAAWIEPAAPAMSHSRPPLRAHLFDEAERLDAAATADYLRRRVEALPERLRVAGLAEIKPLWSGDMHAAAVVRIHHWITEGDCYQVNLTFPMEGRIYGGPLALYAGLRERQPVRYGAYFYVPGETCLSFSPELFFERKGDCVVTRPMKGTAARGATPQEDAAQRQALLTSGKERAENIMIVDLLRNDLGRLADPGAVRVEALCEAEAYPTLWQMVSTIAADLPGVGLFDLFRALFPCGSITGAPKIAAMHKIAALETTPRGIYTGALGWIAPSGDCRLNVAIRTLECHSEGRVHFGIGSGVVIDGEPGREYAECLLKAQFLADHDPGFELIETMRLEAGELSQLELHLERLAASAEALGFHCDLFAIRAALAGVAASHPAGVHRLRLTLSHNGRWHLGSAFLPEAGASPCFTLFANEALDSGNYLLRHKTSVRAQYDRALAAISGSPDIFDVIFINERGEVCEGARSNVFVERGGKLLTPPVNCGLLPGVLRRQLIESGRAVEAVLLPDDLCAAPFYLGNALRGLVRVSLKESEGKTDDSVFQPA